jgi:unsaturated pyranuronate lyase
LATGRSPRARGSSTSTPRKVWNVVDGEFEIIIAGESMLARPGVVAVAPANAPHSVTALCDGRAIVVDHPVRGEIGGVRTG